LEAGGEFATMFMEIARSDEAVKRAQAGAILATDEGEDAL
jgi:hypothetical protein